MLGRVQESLRAFRSVLKLLKDLGDFHSKSDGLGGFGRVAKCFKTFGALWKVLERSAEFQIVRQNFRSQIDGSGLLLLVRPVDG